MAGSTAPVQPVYGTGGAGSERPADRLLQGGYVPGAPPPAMGL
ncbi:protein of unknown function [Blastococcus saxobsidens DD2]|uniref:Uncharacterized protein n=1 Tax=Blastococcus saxobsidens (strain DD2) TaxID=1146883 RepID=H6RMW2_BLASD|nr:protein of unknown function [Blastococcus saxobsidens DD2]